MKTNPDNGLPVWSDHTWHPETKDLVNAVYECTAWTQEHLVIGHNECDGLGCKYCYNGVLALGGDTISGKYIAETDARELAIEMGLIKR